MPYTANHNTWKLIKKWCLRFFITGATGVILLIITILNPTLLYSHETVVAQITIRHNAPLDSMLELRVVEALEILKSSKLYDKDFKISLCLNEGLYPKLIETVNGEAFGHGFYNIAHVSSEINATQNRASINGYHWQLDHLIAHEIVHTYQFNQYGLKSKFHAPWKVEGYAEYISRHSKESLYDQITQFQSYKAGSDHWPDMYQGSGVPLDYFHDHLLVRYMIEELNMSYTEIIADTHEKHKIDQLMMDWHKKRLQTRIMISTTIHFVK